MTDQDDDDTSEIPRSPDDIPSYQLEQALADLTLMDDPFLRMQITNLTATDQVLMNLEQQVLHRLVDEERTPIDDTIILLAFSQMWLFGAYELLRTWRQRAKDFERLHANGGIDLKIAALAARGPKVHPVRDVRIEQLKELRDDPDVIKTLRDDLRRTHIPFRLLEALRVSLAKHEVSGKKNALPYASGYGRINRYTGSLDFEISMDHIILEVVSRRGISDALRAFSDGTPLPDDDTIKSFDDYISGVGLPTAPESDAAFSDEADPPE